MWVPLCRATCCASTVAAGARRRGGYSASATSCGSFDYFLQEAGLRRPSSGEHAGVQSPFDYARQGRLVVVDTVTDPRDAAAYTRELVAESLAC